MNAGNIPTVSKLRKQNAALWKHVYKYFKIYFKKKDDESLHQARVEIKKLSAWFHLLEFGDRKFDSRKELKPVEKIFKLSGKLRDYKNACKFCKEYKIKHAGLKAEGKKQPSIRKELKRNLEKYDKRLGRIEKEAASELKKIEAPKYIGPYLLNLRNEIIAGAAPSITAENLHGIRKKIKELLFLDEYDTINLLKKTETGLLVQLQDTIGDWHDIDKFYRKTLKRPGNKKQRRLLTGIENERQKLFAQSKSLLSVYTG